MSLFAVDATDIDVVAGQLEPVVGIPFDRRDSSFWGEYDLFDDGRVKVHVFYNRDPMFEEGDPPEEMFFQHAFRDHAVLVDVYGDDDLDARIGRALFATFPGSTTVQGGTTVRLRR
jgi:hypothetical protein